MLDEIKVDDLRQKIRDRFTAAELVDILELDTLFIFDTFLDDVLDVDWSELL